MEAAGHRASMGMVSCKAVGVYARIAERSATTLEALSAGLPLEPVDLVDPSKRIPWDAFCELGRRVEETCGGPGDFVEAATEFTKVPSMSGMLKVSRLLTSVRLLYWSAHRWVGPQLFPGTRSDYEVLSDGRIRFSLQIPEELCDSPQFFRLNLAGMRAMPRILGQPDARVVADIQPRRATYVISPPPSMTLWARLRRSLIVLTSARATFDELATQNQQLLEQLDELHRARAQAHEARLLADAARKEAEEANALKTRFLANVSHELRTPLNAILGLTGLVLEGELSEDARSDIASVRRAGSSLLALVDDLLDISRIEAGKLELQEIDFDLRHLLEGVRDMFAQIAREQGVSLAYRMAHETPTHVVGDPGRLRQVLMNLVGNALKFTPAGGEVELRVSSEPGEDHEVFRFEVADTGPGIPEQDRERIFLPFVQGDGTHARRHGGTGLGLSISRDLVERLGGSIELESEPGRGSRFTVLLPLPLAVPADHEGRPALERRRARRAASSARVLVVDDDAVNQRVLARQLEQLGLEAVTASGGREALETLERVSFRAVFMDCQMPDVDGYEATRRWRERERVLGGRLPIIAVTANAMAGARERCLACGMDDYLAKPVSKEALAATLERWRLRDEDESLVEQVEP